jgi:hypothetical protein
MLSLGTRETYMLARMERYSSWDSLPYKALRLFYSSRETISNPTSNKKSLLNAVFKIVRCYAA